MTQAAVTQAAKRCFRYAGIMTLNTVRVNGMSTVSDNLNPSGSNSGSPSGNGLSVSQLQTLDEVDEYFETGKKVTNDMRQQGFTDRVLPKYPITEFLNILGLSKKSKEVETLRGVELHEYLKNKLVSGDFIYEISVPETVNSSNATLGDALPYLKEGYKIMQNINAKTIHSILNYGVWLNIAFHIFECNKGAGLVKCSWGNWLKQNVGLSDSYARQYRELSTKFSRYKKIHYVSITFTELWKRKLEIYDMLNSDETIAKFWMGIENNQTQ